MIQVYWEAKPRFKKIAGWLKSTGRVEIEASPNHPLDIAEVQAGIERRLVLKRPDFFPDGAEVEIKLITRI